jgi:methanethiol S-methyltransferase
MKYTVLIILWFLWCLIHSGMISLTINDYLKNRFGRYYKFYRLFYNLTALITLIPLIIYSQSLKGSVLFQWEGCMMFVQFLLIAAAITLFAAGALKYDMLQFLGVQQIKSGKSHSTLSEIGEIETSGILGITRHPWYLAAIIFVWVDYREMYVSTLIVNILLTIYLFIGTALEERKLIIQLGDTYKDYMNRVSMLFPMKWIVSKLLTAKKANSPDR